EVMFNGDANLGASLNVNKATTTGGGRITNAYDSLYLQSTGPVIEWNQSSGDVVQWFSGGGGSLVGVLSSGGRFESKAASGQNAFLAATGARWKIGGGTTDYLSSDGSTTISAAGTFAAPCFTARNDSGVGGHLINAGTASNSFFLVETSGAVQLTN